MKILAFDTSSTTCSVALLNTDNAEAETVQSLSKSLPMQQGTLILPLVKQLLEQCNLTLQQLDAVAYDCGPGSFTGIRIANSVAQGIGFAVKLPIIQVSSLAAIAQAACMSNGSDHCLVAVDARMEQIYWAAYKTNAQGIVELVGSEQVCAPNLIKFNDEINVTNWCGVGDGWEKYGADICHQLGESPKSIDAAQLPNAEAILVLAKAKFERGEWVTAAEASPIYLR